MIILTLGTIPYSFDRAITWLHLLLEQQVISEPVFIQSGVTDTSLVDSNPLATVVKTIESKKLIALVKEARLVISHGGQGSTRMLASQQASFVLLPRLARFEEHIDDHQLLFAKSMQRFGVKHCLALDELRQFVLEPPPPFRGQLFNGPKLADHLIAKYPGLKEVAFKQAGCLETV
ncbi:glycosyltransferase [Thermoleptolyngbya sp. C42_A2020_037]|uniref:glycosyltransferase n=1 Tax=Thermoleptolyngbya sp. C42_A2020_037 TaxID=2747799 RepID=UPI0019FCB812|nr:glycosyltransferase [Thermoleptolyngbya sp. C42_A2020_037]MBF2084591.1 glycosyl transferase [Thermoleptolyngbya sp. C42_A2020_037]